MAQFIPSLNQATKLQRRQFAQKCLFDPDGHIDLYCGSHGKNIPNTVPVWSCIGFKIVPNQIIHDYFPVHWPLSVKEYMKSNHIAVLPDWPRKSGDLMPLEDVWREIITRFETTGTLANNLNELWIAICQVFNDMNAEGYFSDVILGIPQKLRKMIENDGDWVNAS
ncbi:hypothetical protein GHT06_013523 [Daphnia sinensis]|uniref:Uncharacterized protein n=1 Tax=Daphnia sinensis TaxID=1820382 RepID=A0AAD5LB99_9CRUS|nr:hypothetical protein GHT06_013523 [Daphnia sinensis]